MFHQRAFFVKVRSVDWVMVGWAGLILVCAAIVITISIEVFLSGPTYRDAELILR